MDSPPFMDNFPRETYGLPYRRLHVYFSWRVSISIVGSSLKVPSLAVVFPQSQLLDQGSIDDGLQDSVKGLKVKGEPCVWCGGAWGPPRLGTQGWAGEGSDIWVCLKIRYAKIQWLIITFQMKTKFLGYISPSYGQSHGWGEIESSR